QSEIIRIDKNGDGIPDPDPNDPLPGTVLDTGDNHSGYIGVENPNPSTSFDDGAINKVVDDWNRQTFSVGCLKNLSNNAASSGFQDIAVSQNAGPDGIPGNSDDSKNVYVVWEDKTGGNFDVLFKRSTDNGATFEHTINLSNNPGDSRFPQVAVSGNNVYVVWPNYTSDTISNFVQFDDILFKRITNNGSNFDEPTINLSRDSSDHKPSMFPKIAVSGNNVYVVWNELLSDTNADTF